MAPAKKLFSVAIVCVCALALVSGCKKTASNNEPIATTTATPTVAPVAAAPAAPAALALTMPPKLMKDIDAMPRIAAATTPALTQVNAMMDAIDKDAKD